MGKFYILVIVLLFTSGCATKEAATPAARPVEAGYITVTPQSITLQEQLTGRVKASLEAEIRPQVDGIIKERLFQEGQFVEKGQILYRLEDNSYQAAYRQAKAAFEDANVAMESAKLKSERFAELAKSNAIARQELDDTVFAYRQAQAHMTESNAVLETASINLSRAEIRSPISGYIGISAYTPGALVTANQTAALASVRAVETVYVDMTQSAQQLQNLKHKLAEKTLQSGNAEVVLSLEDGSIYQHKGKLQLKEVAVNESTGAVTLRAEFPNPDGRLMPGMYVKAAAAEAVDTNGILVQQQGILWDAKGTAFAMLIDDENTVEKRDLKVGAAIEDKWVVLECLAQGDRLIIEGVNKIRPGDKVTPIQLDDTTPQNEATAK